MGLKRNARRHEAGIVETDWLTYQVGQRVMTPEGFPGVIVEAATGPFPQTEEYEVVLDDDMGGGTYDGGELTPLDGTTAALSEPIRIGEYTVPQPVNDPNLHVASEDYPELSEILVQRPPLAHSEALTMSASKTAGPHDYDGGENDSGDDLPDLYEQPDAFWDEGEDDSGDDDEDPEHYVTRAASKTAAVPVKCTDCGDTYFSDDVEPEHDCRTGLTTEGGWLWDNVAAPVVEKGLSHTDQYNPDRANYGSWSYDWCRFRRDRHCWYPNEMDLNATQQAGYAVFTPVDRGICTRDKWEEQKACSLAQPGPKSGDPGALLDATVPWSQGGQRGGVPTYASRMQVEAAFEFTATWADVRKKASAIRSAGGVRVVAVTGDKATGQTVTAEVRGSSSIYETAVISEPGRSNVALWTCGCPWAAYSWGRSGRWKKYEGRMCAHALALSYEVQARGMFGKNVVEDAEAPEWSTGDVQRPGDYQPPMKAASLRPVVLDGDLAPSVAAWIAREMLDSGQHEAALAYLGEKIVSEAATLDFKGRLRVMWRGMVKTVQEVIAETATVIFTDGQQASVRDVHYETYHPSKGLMVGSALSTDEAVFEGGDVEAVLHDEPEAALPVTDGAEAAPEQDVEPTPVDEFEPGVVMDVPTTDEHVMLAASHGAITPGLEWLAGGGGGSGKQDGEDIAKAAQEHLAKMALKDFTPAERAEIIEEGIGVRAGNFDSLDITGTHYEGLADDEDDDLDLL